MYYVFLKKEFRAVIIKSILNITNTIFSLPVKRMEHIGYLLNKKQFYFKHTYQP